MVTDLPTLENLRQSWHTVRVTQAMIQANTAPLIFSMVPAATGFARLPESLLLVFGVSVLEDALRQICDEGAFSSKRKQLGSLMEASRSVVPWKNFDAVHQIRERRNGIAHDRAFLAADQCSIDLDTLAVELIAWGVLEHDYADTYKIEFRPS